MSAELLLSTAGALILFCLMASWEAAWIRHCSKQSPEPLLAVSEAIKTPLPESTDNLKDVLERNELEQDLKNSRAAHTMLAEELENLREELCREKMEKERLQQNARAILSELDSYKKSAIEQLEAHKTYIDDLQTSLVEQRSVIEKKQQQIGQLETKVGDLTYEIKTLLQLAEKHSDSFDNESHLPDLNSQPDASEYFEVQTDKQVLCADEAALQLKRCLDIAQKITGSHRFNAQVSPFLDSPADNFTLDLRRLCESLRNENNSAILLYSPKENEPLFANNQIKALTGWNPEKFLQNFNDILQEGKNEWKQAVFSLAMKSDATVKLGLKTKTGNQVIVQGHLGLIPTGIFRNHVIAVLYPAEQP